MYSNREGVRIMMIGLVCMISVTVLCVPFLGMVSFSETDMEQGIVVDQVNYNLPGVMAIVVKNGETVASVARGYEDVVQGIELTKNSVIQLGSISKVYTAYALLQLLNAKEIEMDALIQPYLPDYLANNKQFEGLTFDNLLLHTTGIPSTKFNTASREYPEESFFNHAKKYLTDYQFDSVIEKDQYTIFSNVGYVLAGVLLESISKKSYEEYMTTYVFKPLGMSYTANLFNEGLNTRWTKRYDVFGGESYEKKPYFSLLKSSDDLVTTGSDVERFLHYFTSTKSDMLTRRFGNNPFSSGRSYGFTVIDYFGEQAFLHDGAIPGANARLMIIPRLQIGMFLYYNASDPAAKAALTKMVLKQYIRGSGKERAYDIATGIDVGRLSGRFTPINHSGETMERYNKVLHQIRVSDFNQGLMIANEFYQPLSETIFYCKETSSFAEFRLDEQGRLDYLIIGNNIYTKTSIWGSAIFHGSILVFLGLINVMIFILLIRRWTDLKLNRVEEKPRFIVLLNTMYTLLVFVLLFVVGRQYNSWSLTLGATVFEHMLRAISWGIPLVWLMLLLVVRRSAGDYRWKGWIYPLIRMNVVLQPFFFIWLKYYKM